MDYTVAIFFVDRAYGGPEEGGWWYDFGEPDSDYARFTRGFRAETHQLLAKELTYSKHLQKPNVISFYHDHITKLNNLIQAYTAK